VISAAAAKRVLAGLPVSALNGRLANGRRRLAGTAESLAEEIACVDSLERLGVRTLGELAALPAAAVADRFGQPGLRALRLARGDDEPLRTRRPHEEIECRLGLPEAASGPQLESALGLLIERLLAHPRRRGRTIRRLRLEARLAGDGGWRVEVALRSAAVDPVRLRLALAPRLAELPGPAAWLGLRAVELGPEAGEQQALAHSPDSERRGRLAEAVRQARSAGGRDAVMRVVEVDPGSRVPERRAILTPFGELGDG
jgi:protein ImuB